MLKPRHLTGAGRADVNFGGSLEIANAVDQGFASVQAGLAIVPKIEVTGRPM